ncbi:MAG TPA: Crp/Fnr family transcriptional regulator [Rhodocyclaceae bacterium]|nr:Crp/Fnr family transcriptional regulator [Rhodocyclaceae bacterium]
MQLNYAERINETSKASAMVIGDTCHHDHAAPTHDAATVSPIRMLSAYGPKQNRLLAALPTEEYERILPSLEFYSAPQGSVINESGDRLDWVYFPISGIVSLGYPLENGASPAIAIAGNDGLVGMALFMGGDRSPTQAEVQIASCGYRLRASALRRELQQGGRLLPLSMMYAQAMISQVTQTAVCNRLHSVEQQLCRWLLMIMDAMPSGEVRMTQQGISNMIGVRRESVTMAAGSLQADNLIQYNRGCIHVLNRHGLEERACECYSVVKKEFDRLLPGSGSGSGSAQRSYAIGKQPARLASVALN